MSEDFPQLFLERLERILPGAVAEKAIHSLRQKRVFSIRINLLKTNIETVKEQLHKLGVQSQPVSWFSQALVLDNINLEAYDTWDIVKNNFLYRQSLSSMLPVQVLNPCPGERVLDLCAAPGSKTTQIAAAMNQEGDIMAVDSVRPRFYRLKAVCDLMGAKNISFHFTDGRRFRGALFDKILVDAPCSSESRFNPHDPDSFRYWSLHKIKEMVRKQRGLLLSATRLLKPGGVLVYSTCTFAPEENEGVVDWVLKKGDHSLDLVPVDLPGEVSTYPCLQEWGSRHYDSRIVNCARILPDQWMEGFFIAKWQRRV